MQKKQLNIESFKLENTGAKNSRNFHCTVSFAELTYIGSSGSGTSVSDYIENKTKPVGRFYSVYAYKLHSQVRTMSVSNVKNHNSRPEIVLVSAKSVESEDFTTAIKLVQGWVRVK